MPTCTYCHGSDFLEGPSGGMSTNILCANPKCRHWFNYTPGFGMDDLKRVEPSEDEKKTARDAAEKAEAERPARLAAEGFGLYFGGKPASDCMIEKPYGGYAAAQDAVLRLCGYVDAMRADKKK